MDKIWKINKHQNQEEHFPWDSNQHIRDWAVTCIFMTILQARFPRFCQRYQRNKVMCCRTLVELKWIGLKINDMCCVNPCADRVPLEPSRRRKNSEGEERKGNSVCGSPHDIFSMSSAIQLDPWFLRVLHTARFFKPKPTVDLGDQAT